MPITPEPARIPTTVLNNKPIRTLKPITRPPTLASTNKPTKQLTILTK